MLKVISGEIFLHNPTMRVPGLDTLRTLAILAVVAFHLWGYHGSSIPGWFAPVARVGWMGVDLFFVLSGYLIANQLFRIYSAGARPSLLRFYRNRLFRILPAYLAVLALYFYVPGWTEDPALAPLGQYLSFTWNLLVDYTRFQGFSHVWSLCVEEHFYLVLPLAVLALMRRPSSRRTIAVIASVVLLGLTVRGVLYWNLIHPLAARGQEYGLLYLERLYYPTYSRLDGLLAGVVLATVQVFRPQWWQRIEQRGHLLCALGFATIALAIVLYKDHHPAYTGGSAVSVLLGYPLLSLGLACLVAAALARRSLLRYRIPGAKLCATLAYTLYLTHKALMHLIDIWFPPLEALGRVPWLIVYAAICFTVATTLHCVVERPFLRLRARLDGKTTEKAVTLSAV